MLPQKTTFFLFITFFLLAFSSEIHAQEKFSAGISAQLLNTRLLVNISNPQTRSAYRPTSILYAEYHFGKKYCLHTGLGYSMMTQNSDAFKNNINYLAMPLYFKIGRIKENKRLAFTSFYGFNLHYLLSAQHIIPDATSENITEVCRKFHFDLAVGGGLKYKLIDKVTLETLTSFSLGYFINKPNAVYMDINNFNSGFMLNLSYTLK